MTNLDLSPEGLLPCPFCGGAAHVERHGNARVSQIIECEDCGCSLETGEIFVGPDISWNRRTLATERRNDFLAGALAMREAAAKAVENSVKCCENFSLEYVEHIPVAQSCCGNTVTDRPDQIAETIRAIDPASLTEKPVAPVVDAAMVERALNAVYGPNERSTLQERQMRTALEAALKGEK